jgi:hypothetical protein
MLITYSKIDKSQKVRLFVGIAADSNSANKSSIAPRIIGG